MEYFLKVAADDCQPVAVSDGGSVAGSGHVNTFGKQLCLKRLLLLRRGAFGKRVFYFPAYLVGKLT